MKLAAVINGNPMDLELEAALNNISAHEVEPGVYSALRDGVSHEVKIIPNRDGYHVEISGHALSVQIRDPRERTRGSSHARASGRQNITAQMPGKVVRVLVKAGDAVEAGQGLVVVEAMKMQNEMKSPKAGVVASVLTEDGATVAVGDTLIVIE